MLAGGVEAPITKASVEGFASLKALNSSNDPHRASIPFDKDRSGFVMGEGAGILVLESLESAQKRGANILAEVVGYGSTCDAYHITSPDPEGEVAARAMLQAMEEANVSPKDISYINAHGTATSLKVVPGDKLELSCEIIKLRGPIGVGKGIAKVDGKKVCEAEIMFAIG